MISLAIPLLLSSASHPYPPRYVLPSRRSAVLNAIAALAHAHHGLTEIVGVTLAVNVQGSQCRSSWRHPQRFLQSSILPRCPQPPADHSHLQSQYRTEYPYQILPACKETFQHLAVLIKRIPKPLIFLMRLFYDIAILLRVVPALLTVQSIHRIRILSRYGLEPAYRHPAVLDRAVEAWGCHEALLELACQLNLAFPYSSK